MAKRDERNDVVVGFDVYRACGAVDRMVAHTEMLGVRHVDIHVGTVAGPVPEESQVLELIEACRSRGWTFNLNTEHFPLGEDLTTGMMDAARASGLCRGVVFDECDWQQINAHWVLPQTERYKFGGRHYFADTEGMSLPQAYEAIRADATRRFARHQEGGALPVGSEHLFPVMMHVLARSGFAIAPKLLKETWAPVMLACALGAARQYGTDLWADIDEWWHPEQFGHPMRRFRSALKLAYWLGASNIFAEGGSFVDSDWRGLPRISEQGQILRQFANEYVPENPRPYRFADVRPTTAIVRFDDTCFDIRQRWLGEYPGPLYGHVPAQEASTEWLTLWNMLSHGYLRTDSATHNWETKLPIARSLFAPLNNVVVYDHLASDRDLEGVAFLLLTGVMMPDETMAAVERRVRAGATCLTPPRFLPPSARAQRLDPLTIIPDGAGKWVVPREWYWLHYECWTRGPRMPELRNALEGAWGPDDRLRYVFGDHAVVARMETGDPDALEFTLLS